MEVRHATKPFALCSSLRMTIIGVGWTDSGWFWLATAAGADKKRPVVGLELDKPLL